MLLVATKSGKVGHVVSSVSDGATSRAVSTVCGKTYRESELRTANDYDVCSGCDKKVEVEVEETAADTDTDNTTVEAEVVEKPVQKKTKTSNKK